MMGHHGLPTRGICSLDAKRRGQKQEEIKASKEQKRDTHGRRREEDRHSWCRIQVLVCVIKGYGG